MSMSYGFFKKTLQHWGFKPQFIPPEIDFKGGEVIDRRAILIINYFGDFKLYIKNCVSYVSRETYENRELLTQLINKLEVLSNE